MKYHIKNEQGDTIASFVNKCDRDYSLDALRDIFSDCLLVEYKDGVEYDDDEEAEQ